jgi:hypothetical protein
MVDAAYDGVATSPGIVVELLSFRAGIAVSNEKVTYPLFPAGNVTSVDD